jgi:Anti-sigma-K factor rskA
VPTGGVARVVPVEASSAASVSTRSGALETSQAYQAEPATVRARMLLDPIDVPPGRGLSGPTIAGLALVAGVAAIALGLWAFVTSVRDADPVFLPPTAPATQDDRTIALLSKPTTKRLPLEGSRGRIVLTVGGGRSLLVIDGLARAPRGKTYEAFVLRPRALAPAPAAVFSGGETVVPLSVRVGSGSIVVVTLERAGGVEAPTQTPLYVAHLA